MAEIVVSAPGKVILHGEHAVVYGKCAIAASLDLRGFIRLTPTETSKVRLHLPDIDLNREWSTEDLQSLIPQQTCNPLTPHAPDEESMKRICEFAGVDPSHHNTHSMAVIAFLHLLTSITAKEGKLPSINITIASFLPTSAGLGSSATFSTCLSASLLLYRGLISTPEELNNAEQDTGAPWRDKKELELINGWAFQGEKVIHGNPSGIDNSVSTYGGALKFQNKQITNLEKVPNIRILLTNTRVPRSTKTLVANVRVKYEKYPKIIGPVLDSIEAVSTRCQQVFCERGDQSLSKEDYTILQELIKMNQEFLRILGVSHLSLDEVCRVTARHGLTSKLTGAGGGGCAFTLIPPETSSDTLKKLQDDLHDLGYDSWETTVGGHGVVLHSKLDGHVHLPKAFT